LILAPVGKDARLMALMLQREDFTCQIVSGTDALWREIRRGAGTILMTEEAVASRDGALPDLSRNQPPWSDLPVLLLTRPGSNSVTVKLALATLGNVTLLERPVRSAALVSSVRSALRARERQYEMRWHLREREAASQRKDEFLATLAHELRNPLAPIRNAVSVLRLSGAGYAPDKALEMMDRQIDHIIRLVDDLMEVSRITRGKIELRDEQVDLNMVIATALEASRSMIKAADHEFNLDLPSSPLIVNGDPVRLTQVIANLLNNAAKYTEPGGSISLSARRQGEEAVVTVTDNGIGISADALRSVFDMFVQAGDRHDRAGTGAGLGIGLTLVRSIVELHGGRVTAESPGIGRGARFRVRLPSVDGVDLRPRPEAAAAGEIHGLPRVLVVDDNHDAADSLGAVLQMLGAEVRVVHDGPAALGALEGFDPVAVFLDLGMPGMDGYEVASRIRARPENETRLIAVTGWGQKRDRRKTLEAGFDHHLVKPPDVDALQGVLASLVT
jgi:signal transduction histidine kinase